MRGSNPTFSAKHSKNHLLQEDSQQTKILKIQSVNERRRVRIPTYTAKVLMGIVV
jgi:hypothetical protein